MFLTIPKQQKCVIFACSEPSLKISKVESHYEKKKKSSTSILCLRFNVLEKGAANTR